MKDMLENAIRQAGNLAEIKTRLEALEKRIT